MVIKAPINLFFDVTPLGKIIQIFSKDINIFSDRLFDPIIESVPRICNLILIIKLMIEIGGLSIVLPPLFLIAFLSY